MDIVHKQVSRVHDFRYINWTENLTLLVERRVKSSYKQKASEILHFIVEGELALCRVQ
jgi:hypothetical protein